MEPPAGIRGTRSSWCHWSNSFLFSFFSPHVSGSSLCALFPVVSVSLACILASFLSHILAHTCWAMRTILPFLFLSPALCKANTILLFYLTFSLSHFLVRCVMCQTSSSHAPLLAAPALKRWKATPWSASLACRWSTLNTTTITPTLDRCEAASQAGPSSHART